MNTINSFTVALVLLVPLAGVRGAEASKPVPLTIYALWEGINAPTSNEQVIRGQMDNLLKQFGPGNEWHHPGFAFIYGGRAKTETIVRLAREKGISIGLILAEQAHTRPRPERESLEADLRSFQWRMSTPHWEGYFTGKNQPGELEIKSEGRDFEVPSPSRYSPLGQKLFTKLTGEKAGEIRQIMDKYPGVITCINGIIEEELAVGAASAKKYPAATGYLADYSPFAVTEFRDWLRHRGLYDDADGKFAGQGAPEAITGAFVEINGRLRSPFYSDLDPNTHLGPGLSFNQKFGTSFTSWNLKYWDTELFHEPITDRNFNPMPQSGEKGYTEGGFDAPRRRDNSAWWRAWSWDYLDEGSRYPAGNPANPAFGFRQAEVAHFVRDMFEVMAAAGLPRDIMYAHQIPGESVGADRSRSGASPVWTGYLPASGTVGVTSFGWFDSRLALQYANLTPANHGWGIFEWHPRPFSRRDDPKLYDSAMKELLVYSRNQCRHLFAGWWNIKGAAADPKQIFWLNDSKFAEAIKVFMKSSPDNPPPMPTGVFMDKPIR